MTTTNKVLSRPALILIFFALPFFAWTSTVLFRNAIPSGAAWKIAGSSVAVLISLFFVIMLFQNLKQRGNH